MGGRPDGQVGEVQGVVTGLRGLCSGLGPHLHGFVLHLFLVELSEAVACGPRGPFHPPAQSPGPEHHSWVVGPEPPHSPWSRAPREQEPLSGDSTASSIPGERATVPGELGLAAGPSRTPTSTGGFHPSEPRHHRSKPLPALMLLTTQVSGPRTTRFSFGERDSLSDLSSRAFRVGCSFGVLAPRRGALGVTFPPRSSAQLSRLISGTKPRCCRGKVDGEARMSRLGGWDPPRESGFLRGLRGLPPGGDHAGKRSSAQLPAEGPHLRPGEGRTLASTFLCGLSRHPGPEGDGTKKDQLRVTPPPGGPPARTRRPEEAALCRPRAAAPGSGAEIPADGGPAGAARTLGLLPISLQLTSRVTPLRPAFSDLPVSKSALEVEPPESVVAVPVGGSRELTCRLACAGPGAAPVQWRGLDTTLGAVQTGAGISVLSVRNASLAAAGTRVCVGSCGNLTFQRTVRLLVFAFPDQLTVSPGALVAGSAQEVACTAHNVSPASSDTLSLSLLLGGQELEGVQALGQDVEEEAQDGEDSLFRVTERWLLPPLGTLAPLTLHCQATMTLPGLELNHSRPIPVLHSLTSREPPIVTSPEATPEQGSTHSPSSPGPESGNSSTRPCRPVIRRLTTPRGLELLCEVVCSPGVAVHWTQAPGGLEAYNRREAGARAWLSVPWAECNPEGWFQCCLDPGGQVASLYLVPEICSPASSAALWTGSVALGLLLLVFLAYRLWKCCRPATDHHAHQLLWAPCPACTGLGGRDSGDHF
ncbi:PREDICTED: mucosal addressin cell adhesion molecule 1 [Ceratotherium simum simum]|uniref:Mucosal addressin cell adhesion molecule 1 n=1 Tax=Ceratotherium simum simum TaxID=73337 RepID=A0ABM0I6K9_CERSS|nr:PREDICTED: mucosal addressin cell adhesion molecule 1 [Ceratotherium simum simum]